MPFDPNTPFDINRHITTTRLEAIRYGVQQQIDLSMLANHAEGFAFVDRTGRYLVQQLEATFYGSRPDRYEERMEVPADWWSHFKIWAIDRNAWWCRWWVKRLARPKMRKLVFTAKGHLLFPDIPYSTREHYKTIMVADTHLGWGE